MITNSNIDRLLEIPRIQEFIKKQNFEARLCQVKDSYSLLLYHLPYVIELQDALIENYLETSLSDINQGLMISGSSALGCCVNLRLIDIEELRKRVYDNQYEKLFLSESCLKLGDLYSDIEAFDSLLPVFEEYGMEPLVTNLDNNKHEFGTHRMYTGLKEKYLQVINNNQEIDLGYIKEAK